jgi:large subunit ribosomal protein L7/L12
MAEEEKKEAPKEESKEEVEVPKKFEKLVEEIEKMSVLDLAELVKVLEKKFGVSAQAPVMMAGVPAAGAAGEAVEEKSEFTVVLKGVGEKKIEVIKVVRDITGNGLQEAKDMVDAAASSPQTVKEAVKKEEAEEMKKKFEAAGAAVELK